MKQEELAREKQEKLDKLIQLLLEIPKSNVQSVADSIKNKMDLLKVCYDKSEPHHKAKIHELITYTQLRCFLTGEKYTNTRDSKYIKLKDVIYSVESIKRHIKEKKLPEESSWKAIDIYSFYFGDYRKFFRCFGKGFLEKKMELDKEFIEDVFSTKNIDFEETGLNQHIVPCQKLNIIPSIRTEESVLRIDILKNLFILFQNNKKVAITGISGIGKTFLAKHFTEYYEGKFSNMVWLNCANGFPKAFSQEKGIGLLGSLGLAKEYDSYLGNEKGLMNLVIGHLAKIDGNNLLVLDNLDDSISSCKDEIAFLGTSWNILGTSQQQLTGFENYIAPDFKEESLDLFYTFYTIEKDDDNLIRLLSAIEYHTLTIELLAKTAQQRKLSIFQLVNRFIEKGINVVEKARVIVDHNLERNTNIENIEQYLNIVFDTSELNDEEYKILLNIALLQADSIEIDLFKEVFLNDSSDNKVIDVFEYNVDILTNKGWIQSEGNRIKIHSLVKNILLVKVKTDLSLVTETINYLAHRLEIFKLQDFKNSIDYFKLGENIIKNSEEEFRIIARYLSSYYNHLGLHAKALDLFTHYYSIEVEKNSIWELIENYNELALKLYLLGRYNDALVFCEFIYDFFTESQDPLVNIKSAIACFNDICNRESSVDDQIQNKKTEELFSRLFNNISIFIESSRIFGLLLAREETKEKAKNIIIDCLDYYEILIDSLSKYIRKENDNNHFILTLKYENSLNKYITTSHDLGAVYLLNNEEEIALHYFKEVLRMQEEMVNPIKSNLNRIYKDLSSFYMAKGDLDNAWEYLVQFIRINENVPKNSPVKLTINRLIDEFETLITKENDSEIGKKTLIDLNTIIEKSFELLNQQGQNDTDLVTYYDILSFIYYNAKFYNEAISYKMKSLRILTFSKEDEINEAKSYGFLASCYLALQKHEEGLFYIEKSLKILNETTINSVDLLKSSIEIKKALIFSSRNINTIKFQIAEKIKQLILSNSDLNQTNTIKFIDSFLGDTSSTHEIVITFLDFYNDDNIVPNFNILIQCYHISAQVCFDYFFYEKAILLKIRQIECIRNFAQGQMIFQIANAYECLAVYYSAIPMYEDAHKSISKSILSYRVSIERNDQEIELDKLKACFENAMKIHETIQNELEKFSV